MFDYFIYDIDGDKDYEIIALTKTNSDEWGKHVVFYDVKISSGRIIAEEMYREDFSKEDHFFIPGMEKN